MGRALACPANVARTLGVRRGSLKLQLPVTVAHSHGKVNKQNAIIELKWKEEVSGIPADILIVLDIPAPLPIGSASGKVKVNKPNNPTLASRVSRIYFRLFVCTSARDVLNLQKRERILR